jgi:hypothetical protein
MPGLPKIVLERLKRKTFGNQRNRQSTIENQQFPHPDANLLAAFVEKSLTERERTQVLNHLAQCAECRELAALTLPAKVDVAQLKPLPARRGWNAWPTLRWGALAAALGAVAIAVVLHPNLWRRQETVSKAMRPTTVASAGKAARQSPAELSAQPSPETAAAKAGAESRESPRMTAKLERGAGPPQGQQIAAHPAGAKTRRPATLMAVARPPVAAGALPPRAEPAAVSTGLNAGLVGRVSPPNSTSSAPHAAAALRAKSYPAESACMAFTGKLESAVAPLAALWSISPSGKVQRSDDGGKTWEEVRVDDGVTFRVIQAIGRDVWAGGSGGALYHSSDDGAIWTRVSLSSGGNPTTETIVAIISSTHDLEHITVRTVSGEQWTTDDGGQHWQREP